MLKITIDNEEVLSNKNFTIEEEMLNTPSVVLDNVYPKSWENDKDYVSRFYHPNDYSKCLIKDENYTPAEPGLNVEGTNFQITADTTKLNELTSMKGQTTQSGTPTPTAPQPINVVSGRQDIVVAGKNTLPQDKYITTRTTNGITFTNNGDGTFNLVGTASANTTIQIIPIGNISLEANQPYYLFSSQPYNVTTFNLSIAMANNGTKFILANGTYTPTATPTNVRLQFYIASGKSVNATNVKVMLVKGNTAPSQYEPYQSASYPINLGDIELCKIGTYQDRIFKTSGINLFDKNNVRAGYRFGADGEYYASTGYNATEFIKVKPSTTYSTSWTMDWSECVCTYDNSQTFVRRIQSGTNFTTSETEYYIRADVKDAHLSTAQINEGSTALPYEPYGSGTWYIEKKIGKVVLDGSENWNADAGTQGTDYRHNILRSRLNISNPIGINGTYMSNYFRQHTMNNDSGFFGEFYCNSNWFIFLDKEKQYLIEGWKDWLSTHNTEVYYVLATPTTTEITDTELISQLESIELLEGLNNVSVVSPYLQGIINLHYNFVNEETTSNLLFCGVVKNSGNISLNPRYPHYQSLQILDFKTFLSEGETLDFVIANKTIEEAIDQIISTIAPYGFIKGNIQIIGADNVIGAYSTKDKTAYDVFNYLADITQSRWTTRLIDENTVAIDFYDPTLLPQGTPINYNETWFRNNLIDDMSYSYGSNDYRNKQVMTSNEVYGSILQTQTMVANGYQTQFDTELKIGQITSITANGTQLTIATNEQKELGFNADIYYTPGNNYFESADLRSTGEILIVNYIAIVEGRQIITNGTEINRVATATGRKGIVARYENRNDANTSNELQLIGQSYIRYKGTPEIKLTIVSRKNIWNIGDRVQFNAPINELATEYMVKKKTINRILANPSSEEHIVYTYEMTSSFNSEQAINYFDNQRAKAKGNIGESEYITRNVDIENVANIIFYGSNVEQATITGDNTLQATLSSPIIN